MDCRPVWCLAGSRVLSTRTQVLSRAVGSPVRKKNVLCSSILCSLIVTTAAAVAFCMSRFPMHLLICVVWCDSLTFILLYKVSPSWQCQVLSTCYWAVDRGSEHRHRLVGNVFFACLQVHNQRICLHAMYLSFWMCLMHWLVCSLVPVDNLCEIISTDF